MRRSLAVLAFAVIACAPATKVETSAPRAAASAHIRFDTSALDRRVDPCTDFYDFACGGWRASHPIPPDRARWSRYSQLQAENLERERAILEDAARSKAPGDARIGGTYAACMDEAGIEARGLAPLRDVLDAIETMGPREVTAVVADLHGRGVFALFDLDVDQDLADPQRMVAVLDKARLGLPDREDYLGEGEKSASLRSKYRTHLVTLLAAIGSVDAEANADRLIAFETTLARSALSAAARRDRTAQYHPMTLAVLRARYPRFDWVAYLAAVGAPRTLERLVVRNPAWLEAVDAEIGRGDLRGLRAYLRVRLVSSFTLLLPRAVGNVVAELEQRTLRGVRELPPRWKRCIGLVDRDVGDEVGRVFLARHFPEASRAQASAIVARVVSAFRQEIAASEWLGPTARAAALAKLERGLVVIGASNRPRSFEGLVVDAGDPVGNASRARRHALALDLAKLERPTDREAFFQSLPQELDGFGSKSANATGFTAGFLQPPVFDPAGDAAVTFGGFGAVVGHELTHQFDDEGRKYDHEGRAHAWWSPEDVARFEARAQCFVDEYARFRAEDGTPVDGKLTLGENIADNGGLRLAYAAASPSETGPRIEGFTPAQRFFLGWAQIRCENVTPEAARRQALHDEHAPGRARVDGVVANMPEFARAFACAPGTPMAPQTRCRVW